MGLSTAGIIFKPTPATPGEPEMIRRAFGESLQPVTSSEAQNSHDVRYPDNIAVESTNGATCIYAGDPPDQMVFDSKELDPAVFAALGSPATIVVFCHYDSGATFGYTIIENGVRARSRLYSNDATSDQGTPLECELSWLSAEQFFDEEEEEEEMMFRNSETCQVASEFQITPRLLRTVVTELFGVCPWDDWSYKTKFNYYRT